MRVDCTKHGETREEGDLQRKRLSHQECGAWGKGAINCWKDKWGARPLQINRSNLGQRVRTELRCLPCMEKKISKMIEIDSIPSIPG